METKRARITVRVQPAARTNRVLNLKDGVLHVRISATPAEGKANKALIKFLSEILDISKSRVTIEKGLTSRTKLLVIDGLTNEEFDLQLKSITDFT